MPGDNWMKRPWDSEGDSWLPAGEWPPRGSGVYQLPDRWVIIWTGGQVQWHFCRTGVRWGACLLDRRCSPTDVRGEQDL